MDRLVFIIDDIDDVLGLALGGLGRPGFLAAGIGAGLVTGATVMAGWRGMILALMANGLVLAWLSLAAGTEK